MALPRLREAGHVAGTVAGAAVDDGATDARHGGLRHRLRGDRPCTCATRLVGRRSRVGTRRSSGIFELDSNAPQRPPMRRPHHLRLCPPAPLLVGDEVSRDIAKRWDRWHPYDRPFELYPWIDDVDPDKRINEMAEWFVDRAWDEVVALGLVSEFRNFSVFPPMTHLWWTLTPASSKSPRYQTPP